MKIITDTPNVFLSGLNRFGFEVYTSINNESLISPEFTYVSWGAFHRKPSRDIFLHRQNKGLVSYCLERGALPNTLIFDPTGFNYDSLMYSPTFWNIEKPLERIEEWIENFKKDKSSLEIQGNKTGIDRGDEEVIFVPLQLESDYVIQEYSGYAESVEFFQHIVVYLANQFKDKTFWVKNHPLAKNKFISLYPNIKIVDDYHYKECLDKCDKILTINSGVGLQALMWEKPVITIGLAFYDVFDKTQPYNIRTLEAEISGESSVVSKKKMLRFFDYLVYELYSDVNLYKGPETEKINATSDCEFKNVRIYNPIELEFEEKNSSRV